MNRMDNSNHYKIKTGSWQSIHTGWRLLPGSSYRSRPPRCPCIPAGPADPWPHPAIKTLHNFYSF